jgi:hypothetical protein
VTPVPDNHWVLRAACRGEWNLFDSVERVNGEDHYPHEADAKAICSRCPVQKECNLAGENEVTNIWAGEIKGGKK